jgi:hypothetical protein
LWVRGRSVVTSRRSRRGVLRLPVTAGRVEMVVRSVANDYGRDCVVDAAADELVMPTRSQSGYDLTSRREHAYSAIHRHPWRLKWHTSGRARRRLGWHLWKQPELTEKLDLVEVEVVARYQPTFNDGDVAVSYRANHALAPPKGFTPRARPGTPRPQSRINLVLRSSSNSPLQHFTPSSLFVALNPNSGSLSSISMKMPRPTAVPTSRPVLAS